MKRALFVLLAITIGALSSGCNAIGHRVADSSIDPTAYSLGAWEGYCEGGGCGHASHVNVGHVDGGYVERGYVDGGYVDGGYADSQVDGGYVDGGCGCSDGNCHSGDCVAGCGGDCGTGCGSCAGSGHGPGGLLGELGIGSGRIAAHAYRHCANGHQNLAAGPSVGAVTYPYYTVRGPRDFLAPNPPSIGP